MNVKKMILLAASISLMALWGCSSSMDSAGVPATDPEPDVVGTAACQVCHSGAHSGASSGLRSAGSENLVAPLAAGQTIYDVVHTCENCHGAGQFHVVDPVHIAVQYPQPDAGSCSDCHGQIDAILAWDSHIYEDSSSNDAPACSSCHKPLTLDSAATAAAADCMSCHGDPAVVTPAASPISAQVAASMHYLAASHTGGTGGICQRCHHEQGYLAFVERSQTETVDPTGNTAAASNYVVPNPLPTSWKELACYTCHEPHDGALRIVAGWDPNQNSQADQFDMCTACHNLYTNAGSLVTTYYHNESWYRDIKGTHYDNPSTTAVIEGYVVRAQSDTPCFDCHGHELRANTRRHLESPAGGPNYGPTIFTDWANSAHAGGLLAAKVATGTVNGATGAITIPSWANWAAAGVTDVEIGNAWIHYDWDDDGRQSCQRCHTATGASNFMSDPVGYDATANDFSHLSGWSVTDGSPQNELLYCWGCHSNASQGELNNPGPITEVYDPLVTVVYPDINGSNVCMSCHLGREIGEVIKVTVDADGTRNFINSHYLATGAQVFAIGGYHYTGRNYNNVTYYAHDKIGTVDEPGTGENGPCVSCHMSSGQSHNFLPVTKDGAGLITAITATVCSECHTGGYALTPGILNTEEEEYDAALEALDAALAAKGIHFDPSAYPYFFDGGGGSYTHWELPYGIPLWQDTMGAAFNLNLLAHDPGGYAHNRYYIKALIWDSIDFIDDGLLNASTATTLPTLGLSAPVLASVQAYMGSSRPGDVDRP